MLGLFEHRGEGHIEKRERLVSLRKYLIIHYYTRLRSIRINTARKEIL